MITVDSQGIGAGEEGLRINPAMKRHFELEIKRRCKVLQEM
jgi:hypothetical protein